MSGAASDALREVLTGPVRSARVVGAGPFAAYLDADPDIVAIVTSDAVRLPCAVFLAHGQPVPSGLAPSTDTLVGRGAISWATGDIRVQRWWRASQVQPAGVADEPVRALTARLADHALPAGVPAALESAAACLPAGDVDGAAESLAGVLGLGAGLTPSADDAIAGLLLGARATRLTTPAVVEEVGARLCEPARARTTAVSAALLAHAAVGRAAPQVVAVAEVLRGVGDTDAALNALWQLGHSSGADTAAGLLVAARAALAVSGRVQ